MRRIGQTGCLWVLASLGLTTHALAQEFSVLLALKQATTLGVRGWGPESAPGSASATYDFGQVVDMPQMQVALDPFQESEKRCMRCRRGIPTSSSWRHRTRGQVAISAMASPPWA